MFRRRKKEKQSEIEVPNFEDLELWVPALISQFNLEKGSFTIVPCFGGIMLYIRNEGISWIPYSEIREALGKMDKNKLAESSALLGSMAVVGASATALLPIILVRGIIKGSYRTLTKPPPNISLSYLKTIIKEIVIIEDMKLTTRLLERLESTPYKERETADKVHRLYILRKFLDPDEIKSTQYKILKNLKSFLSRSTDAEFIIPDQANLEEFIKILENDGYKVTMLSPENEDA